MGARTLVATILSLWGCACGSCEQPRETHASGERKRAPRASMQEPPAADSDSSHEDSRAGERGALVQTLRRQGIEDERVLAAIGSVQRHRMVPEEMAALAYEDRPLPIGHEQTISQPYVVALMTQLAEVEAGDKILEVGTGSGYQAAVLAELGAEVFSIEIVEPLAHRARQTLDSLGYERVHTRIGDGYAGWPEQAPFQAVLLTAAPPRIPEPLIQQLAQGGKLVAPEGRGMQQLVVVTMTAQGPVRRASIPVRFVPMTGRAQDRP